MSSPACLGGFDIKHGDTQFDQLLLSTLLECDTRYLFFPPRAYWNWNWRSNTNLPPKKSCMYTKLLVSHTKWVVRSCWLASGANSTSDCAQLLEFNHILGFRPSKKERVETCVPVARFEICHAKKITNKVKSLKHTTKHSSSNISNRVNNFYIQFLECHKSLKLEVKETGANFYRELGSCPKVRVLIPWYHQQCAKGRLHLVWLLSRRYSEFLLILNHDLNSLLRGFLPPGLLNSFNISFEKGILNHSGLASWVDDTPNW